MMDAPPPNVTVISKEYPHGKSYVGALQEYSGMAYVSLFFVLAVVLYQRLVAGGYVLVTGLVGVFAIIPLANMYGMVKMRKTFVEIGVYEDRFYIKNVMDVVQNRPPLYFPLKHANARREGETLLVHYFSRVIPLELREWEDPDQLLRQFSRTVH